MSCRVDTAPLLAGACIVSLYAGHGVRGDAVPGTGTHGPSPVFNDLVLPADAAKEYRWAITTPPSAGSIVAYEDCSYAYTPPIGTTNLTVTYGYTLWEGGVSKGAATETIIIGSGSGDTTAPTLTGSITVSSLTSSSYTLAWPAGSDNVAVTSYERSLDAGTTWVDVGNVLTVNISGRTPSTTDQVRIRAKDAAGNVSTALSTSVTLPAASDTTPPTLTGSITIGTVTSSSIQMSWPAGSDNVAVTSYEVSSDGGSSFADVGNVLTHTFNGLAPSTAYALMVRAKDAAGNVSGALVFVQSTSAAPDTTPPTLVGSIAVTGLSGTGYTLTWPAGTDDVAVSSYERSLDGGTSWTDVGNVLTVNISGRTPSSTDQVRVRALDAAGNTSTPPLSTAVTLPAAPDTTPPVLVGAITVTAVSTSSIAVVWPAASDNVGVAGYEVSDDGGSAWVGVGNVLAHTYSGLAPSTSYALRVRAVDVAGNVSAALALTQSTAAPAGAWNGGSVRPFVRGGAVGPQGDDYPGSDILRPAEDVLPMDVAERDYIAFDWEDWLAEGEAIIDVVITLEAVGDVDAAERRLGGVERYGNRARQWVEGVQRDAWYLMRATGTTSHGGRRITLGARFKGVRES